MRRKDGLHRDEHRDPQRAAVRAALPRREVRHRPDVPQDADATPIRTPRVRQQTRRRQARPLAAVYPLDRGLRVRHRRGVPRPRHVRPRRAVVRP